MCSAQSCSRAFISRTLLYKHQIRTHPHMRANAVKQLDEKRVRRTVAKFGASSIESVLLARSVVGQLLEAAAARVVENSHVQPQVEEKQPAVDVPDVEPPPPPPTASQPEEYDPVAAAVQSIMGPAGAFDVEMSAPPPAVEHKPPPAPEALIVRAAGQNSQAVLIRPQQILTPQLGANAQIVRAQMGNIPIVRVGQVREV